MSIPFTQYLMPNGRRVKTRINRPPEVEAMANTFITRGGWFESEMLSDYKTVSLTACFNRSDGDNDIAIRVVKNGPEVLTAVDELVREAAKWISKESKLSNNRVPS